MKRQHSPVRRIAISIFALLALSAGLSGQQPRRSRTPITSDWSTRHLIFSNPRTAEQASRVANNFRYHQQWLRRNAPSTSSASARPESDALWRPILGNLRPRQAVKSFRRDWSTSLGAGAVMPPNAFPAKFSFDVDTASCNDFVVFTTAIPDATSTGLLAFNNLYAGVSPVGACPGGPTPLFAYQTLTSGGVTQTSPVLSFFDNGAQVAFIEGGGGTAVLHILKWNAADGGTATAPATVANATTLGSTYATCRATAQSCLLSLTFNNGDDDVISAPFVDYTNDNLYVGDSQGMLHKFSGVFQGTPQEVTTGGWPVVVDGSAALSSPIFDFATNNIYVGDTRGILSFVKDAPASNVGACATGSAPCLGNNIVDTGSGDSNGIADAPIVDGTNQTVFAFIASDGSANGDNSAVFQAPETLATSIEATVGPGAFNFSTESFNPVYSGDFDNNYFNNPGTGFLYVCGNRITGLSANIQNAAIYRIGFNSSGVMNSANDGNRLDISTPVNIFLLAATACSPGTEIFNGNTSTDLIFFSVQNNGNQANCAGGGCVMSFNITSSFPATSANSLAEAGGTSGIIIDNIVPAATTPQAASLYFTRLAGSSCPTGTTGCAVKLTQSALQ